MMLTTELINKVVGAALLEDAPNGDVTSEHLIPADATAVAELAAREPRNGTAQALLGLSYQLSADRNPQALDLALAGYDLAARAEPGQYWPAAMAGRGAFDQGKYDDALNHFSRAALLRPDRYIFAVAP